MPGRHNINEWTNALYRSSNPAFSGKDLLGETLPVSSYCMSISNSAKLTNLPQAVSVFVTGLTFLHYLTDPLISMTTAM